MIDIHSLGTRAGLQAEILTYGAILRRLTFPARGQRRDLVLTLPDLDAYERDPAFVGILVGRVANRIAGARFTLDREAHRLTANEGRNHLHGGQLGFGKRPWRLLDAPSATRLLLGLTSPAGEEGYPGNLEVNAEVIVQPDELTLRLAARCDRATPLNLTWHPYFNLSGDMSRAAHEQLLRIPASSYLAVDSELIPTGERADVTNTPFDFRRQRPARGADYDHCYVLDADRDCDAELHSPHSGVTMTLHTDRRALQFYGGHGLAGQHPGLSGLCLEPQDFPNAPDILRAGTLYRTTFRYRFAT